MNLESSVKFHAPKSQMFTDSPRATASEALSGTDVMGAFGMVQSRSPLGFSAFSGKMNLSSDDQKKAVQLLTQFGMKHCGRVAALRKLETNVKGKAVQILATFAYADYCRSAATPGARCRDCHGTGRAVNREATETTGRIVEKQCDRCKGVGFSKQSAATAFRAVRVIAKDLTADQWRRGIKQFYDTLVSECEKAESHADSMLRLVTTSFGDVRK